MEIKLGQLYKDQVSHNITIKMTDPSNVIGIELPESDANIQVDVTDGKLYFCVNNDVEERMYELIRNEQGGFELVNKEI
jgi:hypothetical protein